MDRQVGAGAYPRLAGGVGAALGFHFDLHGEHGFVVRLCYRRVFSITESSVTSEATAEHYRKLSCRTVRSPRLRGVRAMRTGSAYPTMDECEYHQQHRPWKGRQRAVGATKREMHGERTA